MSYNKQVQSNMGKYKQQKNVLQAYPLSLSLIHTGVL